MEVQGINTGESQAARQEIIQAQRDQYAARLAGHARPGTPQPPQRVSTVLR